MTTIKDIAKVAEVSVTTVSRALNDYDDVRKETKEKVKSIAEKMGYRPNAVARSLVSKKTRTIGVILSEISREGAKDSVVYEVLCGINDRAAELDYDILLFSTNPKKQQIKSYFDLCKERNVDGAIIFGLRTNDIYLQEVIETSNFPCILIDIPITSETVSNVTTNNAESSARVVDYLIRNGHHDIAMISGHSEAYVSRERIQGFIDGLEKNRISVKPERIISGNFSEDGGAEAMYQILLKHPDVTAVFCASDLMALGAIRTIERSGKKVPDDISIVGFDDITIASYCSPRLTTVRQDRYEMGYQASQMLVDVLEKRQTKKQIVLKNQFIERESTKKLK